jgi:hypothetical protein
MTKWNNIDYKLELTDFVWQCGRYSKYDKMVFLVDQAKTSPSLQEAKHAMVFLEEEAHMKENLLGLPDVLDWWDKNKNSYKGK